MSNSGKSGSVDGTANGLPGGNSDSGKISQSTKSESVPLTEQSSHPKSENQGNSSQNSNQRGRWKTAFSTTWKRRRPILFGVGITYALYQYIQYKLEGVRHDHINDKTLLRWRLTNGAIIEKQRSVSIISRLLDPTAELTKSISLLDAIKTLKAAETDDRIFGIIADMSTPSATGSDPGLGLSQIQDLRHAIISLKDAKMKKHGDESKFIAYCDSHDSQADYFLASAFDKIYVQRSGHVALVGLSNSVPFVRRLLSRFGIEVKGNARKEYKSMISTFTETSLPAPQKENALSLLNDLNDQMLEGIAAQRYKQMGAETPEEGLNKLKDLIKLGPFSGDEAVQYGLIDGLLFKRKALEQGENYYEMNFGHYARVRSKERYRQILLSGKTPITVGLVYVLGGINRGGGPYGANTIVKGLKEAMQDPTVGAIILRVDSGGGDVTASDTMWEAVNYCKEWKYPIIASFGNTAASGGYWIATHADKIIASNATITGSIGVASLRPYFTKDFFDWLGVDLESFFTGSSALSLTNPPDPLHEELENKRMDKIYDDFVKHVAEGRNESRLGLQPNKDEATQKETEEEVAAKQILKVAQQVAVASTMMKGSAATVDKVMHSTNKDSEVDSILAVPNVPIFPNGAQDVEKIAGGRVWTGRQALENGLVDSTSGLGQAVSVAKQLAWDKWDERSLYFVEQAAKLAQKNREPRKRHDVIDGQMEALKELDIIVSVGQAPIPRDLLTEDGVMIKVFPTEDTIMGMIKKARKRRQFGEIDPEANTDFGDYAGYLLTNLISEIARKLVREGLTNFVLEYANTRFIHIE